jgi:p24 family protein beta-1
MVGGRQKTMASPRVSAVAALGLAVIAVSCAGHASAFHFALPAFDEQCFIYEAGADLTTVTVNYLLRPKAGGSALVEAVVYDPQRTVILKPAVSYQDVAHFSFQTASIGRYDVCFKRVTEPGVEMELDIDAALNQDYRDPTVHAVEYEIPVIELMPIIAEASNEIDTLSSRQDRFEQTANSTYFRVIVFTVINALAGLGAGVWQIWNLRRFFKEKKVV